jgi:ABC-type ATPase with predicted acetyltransferase domain
MFGLNPHAPPVARPRFQPPEPWPGRIVLIDGASGSGKSTLLRQYRRRLRGRCIDLARLRTAPGSVIDQFPDLPLSCALQLLARVGLAEAHTYLLNPRRLSAGQRWRLKLALAMQRMSHMGRAPRDKAAVLVCDEFCSCLDEVTAAVVCHALRRFVDEACCGAVVAGSRHLAGALRPDVIVTCDFDGQAIVAPAAGAVCRRSQDSA